MQNGINTCRITYRSMIDMYCFGGEYQPGEYSPQPAPSGGFPAAITERPAMTRERRTTRSL
jgi:hypothetical protein